MRGHEWEDAGEAGPEIGREWLCDRCGSLLVSFDRPWAERGFEYVYVTTTEAGERAHVGVDADCDVETVHRIMTY